MSELSWTKVAAQCSLASAVHHYGVTAECVFACSTASSASTGEGEVGGRVEVEQRLREHLEALRAERRAVLLTAGVELEAGAVLLEPVLPQALLDELPDTAATAHRLDLENAVLMQELAAIKVRAGRTFQHAGGQKNCGSIRGAICRSSQPSRLMPTAM